MLLGQLLLHLQTASEGTETQAGGTRSKSSTHENNKNKQDSEAGKQKNKECGKRPSK